MPSLTTTRMLYELDIPEEFFTKPLTIDTQIYCLAESLYVVPVIKSVERGVSFTVPLKTTIDWYISGEYIFDLPDSNNIWESIFNKILPNVPKSKAEYFSPPQFIRFPSPVLREGLSTVGFICAKDDLMLVPSHIITHLAHHD